MSKKILIVEDNEKNLKLFAFIIDSMGYESLTATGGDEGIRIARENTPALILMDIQMPLIDGISALKTLRSFKDTSNIPVIAVTSYAMKGDEDLFLREGFNGYVAKPVNINELKNTIRGILEKHNG